MLKWYDRVKDQPRYRPLIERVSRDLSEQFIEKERWADLGSLHADPLADLERERDMMKMMAGHEPEGLDEKTKKELAEMPARMFREKVGPVYGGLLAAKRDKIATAYADKAREQDGSPAMAVTLAEWALRVGEPRKQQAAWLAAAKKDSKAAEMLEKVQKALDKK